MIAKTVLSLAVINICLSWTVYGQCNEKIYEFKCDPTDGEQWFISTVDKQRIQCPVESVCNYKYMETTVDTVKDVYPCMAPEVLCPMEIVCSADLKTYKKGGFDIPCQTDSKCSTDKKNRCSPCVVERCDKPVKKWTCVPGQPNVVKVDKMEGTCVNGAQCNANYTAPCEPCITPKGLPSKATTTTTIASITSGTGTPTTTLPIVTTTPKTPVPSTKPPSFNIPNCNDGYGYSQPCRRGPEGSVYYYKCVRISYLQWTYDYIIKFCRDVRIFDPQCFGKVC